MQTFGSAEGILQLVELQDRAYFRLINTFTDRRVTIYFSRELAEKIPEFLDKRIGAYGRLYYNAKDEVAAIMATEISVFPDEADLPTVDEITGILEE